MKRKRLSLIMFMIMAACLSSCGYTKVPAGYEGIKINTLGGGKGAIVTVGVGRHFYPPKYEMELFPLFKQNIVWTASKTEGSVNNDAVRFQSSESLTFSADVGISYSVRKGAAKDLYIAYHKDIDEITAIDMRNSLRDSFNRLASLRNVEGIYGKGKSVFVNDVEKDMRSYWGPIGITIHKVYLVGEMVPPREVKAAISKKIMATQKTLQRENEVAQATAEANIVIEAARGKAESGKLATDADAYAITQKAIAEAGAISLVQKQLSKSPAYERYIKATRWDGKLPTYMGGSMPIPMINVK